MAAETISPPQPLDVARDNYKKGYYEMSLTNARTILEQTPQSAAALILMGDNQRQLGDFAAAHDSYNQALSAYRKRYGIQDDFSQAPEDQRDAAARDMTATEERLIEMDVLLGNYRDARTRTNRLVRNGNTRAQDVITRKLPQGGEVETLLAMGRPRYNEAILLTQAELIQRGEAIETTEYTLSTALFERCKAEPTVYNIMSAFAVLNKFTNHESAAYSSNTQIHMRELAEIAAQHPQRELIERYRPELFTWLKRDAKVRREADVPRDIDRVITLLGCNNTERAYLTALFRLQYAGEQDRQRSSRALVDAVTNLRRLYNPEDPQGVQTGIQVHALQLAFDDMRDVSTFLGRLPNAEPTIREYAQKLIAAKRTNLQQLYEKAQKPKR